MITKEQQIIKFVKTQCINNNVEFYLSRGNYVIGTGNIRCGGYFRTYPYPKLAGIKCNPVILLHEYCHMQQWIEQSFPSNFSKISRWITGDLKFSKYIKNALNLQYEIELDCDKRTIKLLKLFGYDKISIQKYIQRHTLYHLLFLIMRDTQINAYHWWDNSSRDDFKNIVDKMPKKFYYNKDKQLTKLKKLMGFDHGKKNTRKKT